MEQANQHPSATPVISNNGFLLLVAVFPIAIACCFTLLIKAFVAFSTIDSDTEFAEISSPQHNRSITRNYRVKGVTKQLFPNRHLFLIEESNNAVYPKAPIPHGPGPWSATLYTGAQTGVKFRVVLIAVNNEVKDLFNNWLASGVQTGKYPGLALTDSMQELSAVTVQVKNE